MLEKIREHIYWNQENYAYGCAGMLGLLTIIGMFAFMFHVGAKAEQEMKAKEAAELVEKQRKQEEEARLDKIPCTLIDTSNGHERCYHMWDWDAFGMSVDVDQGVLLLDTDGNTNTIELMAVQDLPCTYTKNRFRALTPGVTKTRGEWKKYFRHAGEGQCVYKSGLGHADLNHRIHRMSWDRVK